MQTQTCRDGISLIGVHHVDRMLTNECTGSFSTFEFIRQTLRTYKAITRSKAGRNCGSKDVVRCDEGK